MKGLLVKDLRLISKNSRAMVSMLFIVIIFFLLMSKEANYPFMIAYVTMIAGIYAASTISMDENGKSLPFLMTLPLTRGVYVAEKYLFVISSCFITCILMITGCVLLNINKWMEIIAQGGIIFIALSFYYMIMLPLQLKYSDKSRIALFGVIMLCVIVVLLSKRMAPYINTASVWVGLSAAKVLAGNIISRILSLNEVFTGAGALLLWLMCWGISFRVSLGIMHGKEF